MNFRLDSPKKILIINIFGIGDVLFTTPLMSNLKNAFPDVKIGYLCNRRTVTVLENNPNIDRIFVYERDEFKEVYKKSRIAFVKKMLGFWNEIKKEDYDAVLDVSLSSFTSFFTLFIGIKNRIGFNYKNRSFYLNHKIPLAGYENRHVVEYYLELLEILGVEAKIRRLDLNLKKEEEEWAQDFFRRNGLDEYGLIVGLVPGGGASWGKDAIYKRWKPEMYAKLADKIVEKHSAKFILFGDEQDQDLCREVSSRLNHPSVSACGQTSIRQFAALTQKCSVCILNDGGPLHIASAVGAKTVSIFGPVDERVYGPYPPDGHRVVAKNLACRPCYHQFRRASCEHVSCLGLITVEDVFEKVEEIIS